MNILVFLGNPGKKYETTRHNLSWMVLEKLSFFENLVWNKKFKSEYAKISNGYILKPQTFMNNTGQAVSAALSFFKVKPENLIVIHDELELDYGFVQLKKGGGAGGHNGLRSIIQLSGVSDFYRFRLGISRPTAGMDVASWVLSRFSRDEEIVLDDYCKRAAAELEVIISKQLNPFSKKDLIKFHTKH